MGASPRHIDKYVLDYKNVYPAARILVVATSVYDAAFTTRSANDKRVAPILEMLYALPTHSKILLHFFSNGGSFTATLIARTYRAKMGKPLPVTAMVFDSTPGKATYSDTVRAFAVGLPKNIILQIIGGLILRIAFLVYKSCYWLTGQVDLVDKARADLNNKKLFDTDVPRLYVYSAVDVMVRWPLVEEHAKEAEKLGYTVQKEKFQESSHCAHLIIDPVRYRGAVRRLWSSVSA